MTYIISKETISESEINELRDWLKIYLEDLNFVLDHSEPWLLSYFKKINAEDKAMELDIYSNLIQEVQPLLEYRKTLLIDPIELNFEIQPNSKEYQAVQRAVDTGKPFNWYHFGTAELQDLLSQLKFLENILIHQMNGKDLKNILIESRLLISL